MRSRLSKLIKRRIYKTRPDPMKLLRLARFTRRAGSMTSISSSRESHSPRDVVERAPTCRWSGCGRCRASRHSAAMHIPLLQAWRPSRAASCDLKLGNLPNSWNLFCREHFVKVAKMNLKILQILPLCPMIWVRVQITEVLAVGLLPVGKLGFHVG